MNNTISKALRYWHTLRYLRPVQIIRRLQYLLRRPNVDDSPISSGLRVVPSQWILPARCGKKMLAKQSFCFLNQTHEVETNSDWNNCHWDKLWLYNLHYFDDLTAIDNEQRVVWHRTLIDRWIDENPPGKGNGWEPYPLSLRIVNWIKWGLAGNQMDDRWLHSLVVQVRFLTQNLESHLMGNHLFANAKALQFAGLFIDCDEAKEWYRIGHKLVDQELPEQVLSDGGNFELSTMYHVIFLEDLLDLNNLYRTYGKMLPDGLEERIFSMFNWLNTMCHPDGEISFFNDAAIGISPSVKEIQEYGIRLSLFKGESNKDGITVLRESGYSRVQSTDVVALIDRAAIGPDYLPGHAHADTLSFELSLFGQRVIVNSGTSIYGIGIDRQQERSTAAHSTIMIDEEDSSEVWKGFRVARRARIIKSTEQQSNDLIQISASHDGYKRLAGKPIHYREWIFEKSKLTINDKITGKGVHAIKSILPLHPSVVIKVVEVNRAVLDIEGNEVVISVDDGGEFITVNSNYHPEFGLSIANQQLVFNCRGKLPIEVTTRICW